MPPAPSARPFFSIGVTTYNRPAYLKQALDSLLRQDFSDFEVIVGNDFPDRPLSSETLGIRDERVRFINHARNLGEMGNMNALLALSRGTYFTWLADDDLFSQNFLQSVHETLIAFSYPPCVFSSFLMDSFSEIPNSSFPPPKLLSGSHFLKGYLTRTIKVQGCCGVFASDYLKGIGGIEQLGSGFSPYSDNLLAIRAGLLERIAFIDAPMVLFRMHDGSISLTSSDIESYISAQQDLLAKSLPILNSETLRESFDLYWGLLLRWCIGDTAAVAKRAGHVPLGRLAAYALFILEQVRRLRNARLMAGTVWFAVKVFFRLLPQLRLQKPSPTPIDPGH